MSLGFLQFAFEAASAIALAATPTQAASAHPAIPAVSQALSPAAIPAAIPVVGAADNPVVAEAASLRPGQFVWQPERATQGTVEIVVSIPLQRAYVYRGGTLIAVTTVSTGRRGHSTPTGTFNILQKHREHYSSLYNNAPMPFMQRLTWGGVALHAGHIPGRPASHGCVRLPLAFARHLYGVTSVGAAVHIVAESPSAGEALALVRANAAYTGMGGPEDDEQTGTN